jgi:hypothetical protein
MTMNNQDKMNHQNMKFHHRDTEITEGKISLLCVSMVNSNAEMGSC